MKQLLSNTSIGLMIGGALVFFVCALINLPTEAAEGGAFVLGAGLLKSLIPQK